MDRLMKLVESSAKAADGPKQILGPQLSVKLVSLTDKDDIEAYLVTFERVMAGQGIPKEKWTHYLAPQLTGKAQLAFAALPSEDAGIYETLKAAILQRYDVNEEAYRRRFRSTTRGQGETNRELAVRIMDLQGKWQRGCKTVEEVQEATGIEQFLSTLTMDKKLWVLEKKPKTCVHSGQLADEYEQVREEIPTKQEGQTRVKECSFCGRNGHLEETCRRKLAEQGAGNKPEPLKCYCCQMTGHL